MNDEVFMRQAIEIPLSFFILQLLLLLYKLHYEQLYKYNSFRFPTGELYSHNLFP